MVILRFYRAYRIPPTLDNQEQLPGIGTVVSLLEAAGPDDVDLVRFVELAHAEIQAGVVRGQEASRGMHFLDLSSVAGGQYDPRADCIAITGRAHQVEGNPLSLIARLVL